MCREQLLAICIDEFSPTLKHIFFEICKGRVMLFPRETKAVISNYTKTIFQDDRL